MAKTINNMIKEKSKSTHEYSTIIMMTNDAKKMNEQMVIRMKHSDNKICGCKYNIGNIISNKERQRQQTPD